MAAVLAWPGYNTTCSKYKQDEISGALRFGSILRVVAGPVLTRVVLCCTAEALQNLINRLLMPETPKVRLFVLLGVAL
jgi:glucose-6-phosphate dehydrogenase assembly protein OpcA